MGGLMQLAYGAQHYLTGNPQITCLGCLQRHTNFSMEPLNFQWFC